jgi:hypothetical protein
MVRISADEDETIVCVTPADGSLKDDELVEVTAVDEQDDVVESKVMQATEQSEEDEDEDDEDGPKVMIGMVCDRKNLYQKWDKHNRYTWSEEYPDDLEEAAENEQTIKYAILVRNSKSTCRCRVSSCRDM